MKRIIALLAVTISLGTVAIAEAWTYEQARAGTILFTLGHCGNFWYRCSGIWFVTCVKTGVNVPGRGQWACIGGTAEARKSWAWWLPPYRTCDIAVVFTPSGQVVTWQKQCGPPVSGVAKDRENYKNV